MHSYANFGDCLLLSAIRICCEPAEFPLHTPIKCASIQLIKLMLEWTTNQTGMHEYHLMLDSADGMAVFTCSNTRAAKRNASETIDGLKETR